MRVDEVRHVLDAIAHVGRHAMFDTGCGSNLFDSLLASYNFI